MKRDIYIPYCIFVGHHTSLLFWQCRPFGVHISAFFIKCFFGATINSRLRYTTTFLPFIFFRKMLVALASSIAEVYSYFFYFIMVKTAKIAAFPSLKFQNAVIIPTWWAFEWFLPLISKLYRHRCLKTDIFWNTFRLTFMDIKLKVSSINQYFLCYSRTSRNFGTVCFWH